MLILTINAYSWFLFERLYIFTDSFQIGLNLYVVQPVPGAWAIERQKLKSLHPNSLIIAAAIPLTPSPPTQTHRCTHGDVTYKGDLRLEGHLECT